MYLLLNPFPIQFLALIAYLILRVTVGLCLLLLASNHYRVRDELAEVLKLSWWPYGAFTTTMFIFVELILGIMFIFGALTQIAALLLAILSLKMLVLRGRFDHHTLPSRMFYFLLLGASLSLFITGAGAFAVDLPI